MENVRKILSAEALTQVLDLFEFDDEEKTELQALLIAAKERGWWSNYPALFDADVQRLFGLEQGLRRFETTKVVYRASCTQLTTSGRS